MKNTGSPAPAEVRALVRRTDSAEAGVKKRAFWKVYSKTAQIEERGFNVTKARAPIQAITLVLASHYPIILIGLEHLLSASSGWRILASCRTGAQALHAVQAHRPDLLLLDCELADPDGLNAVLQKLQQDHLPTRTILLTDSAARALVLEALRLGVRGVVLKTTTGPVLLQCLRKVQAGETWLDRTAAHLALARLLRRETTERQLAKVLTPRERELVSLVATGLTNPHIAQRLGISEGTIKFHLHGIYSKLGLSGRVALTRYVLEHGLG